MSGADGVPIKRPISRRALLAGAAGATLASVGGRAVAGQGTPPGEVQPGGQETAPEAPDTTKVQGRPISELGSRSPYESPRRVLRTTSSGTPHEDLHGIITPSDLHYERHHAGVPDIDPEEFGWRVYPDTPPIA